MDSNLRADAMADFDYYRELHVSRDAGPEEIRAAFRRLAMRHHPDRNPGDKSAERKFQRLAEAYDVLSDAEKRAAYDRGGVEKVRSSPGFRHFSSTDEIFRSFADVIDGMIGERHSGSPQALRGEDYEAEISLTANEATSGGRRNFTIEEETACSACGGSGAGGGRSADCPTCGGRGVVSRGARRLGSLFSVSGVCPECEGRGRWGRACRRCGGRGIHSGPRALELTIPRGVEDRTILRLRGMGGPGSDGGPPGDLLVRVRIGDVRSPDAQAEVAATVDIVTAILGGRISVPVDGASMEMTIPPGTQPGRVFRIDRPDGRGEVRVTIAVEIPRKVTRKQARLLEEFRRERP
jgi:molecular chaperone DnaJ